MPCGCQCSVSLPHGTAGGLVCVYDCGISWSYTGFSLDFNFEIMQAVEMLT